MASNRFRYPPAPPNGSGTFSDNLVGFQIVDGGGLTQGNFEFTTSVVEKVNRKFNTGVFSDPINLQSLNVGTLAESRAILAKNYRVYPNYDISDVTNFSLYGSLQKRLSVSITKIINYFPAGIESRYSDNNYNTGYTAQNIVYDIGENTTTFEINVDRFFNPLDIDYSVNAARNIEVRPLQVSPLRNLTDNFNKFAIFKSDLETEYPVIDFEPSERLSGGTVEFVVSGNLFSGLTASTETLIIKPTKFETEFSFKEYFDEVEDFLLNRLVSPKYTARFDVPRENQNTGRMELKPEFVTWPLDGLWNLDIRTQKFDGYLTQISEIAEILDEEKTDLIVRFLTTAAVKEFDTVDQKVNKILQIYGRSFDEMRKFVDALAYMTSVNYTPQNDIPSQLLVNLAQTLGWNTDVSPITNDNFLSSVFGTKNQSIYPGQTRDKTPNELNYQYYRNLILNSGYLFRSKGTRRSVEAIMRFIGAPKALVEFNETVYLADGPINMSQFNTQFAQISGGTYSEEFPTFDPSITFKIRGVRYTGFTEDGVVVQTNSSRGDFPVDDEGYPSAPTNNSTFFFAQGSGWYETTPKQRSPVVNIQNAPQYSAVSPDSQTILEPNTYGQKYFDRFRDFPDMTLGYELSRTKDNKKSWSTTGLRKNSTDGMNAYYQVSDERLVLNAKNIDLYMNVGQALTYDVWDMSVKYAYPIPTTGLTSPYPKPGGIDWTVIDPKPRQKTFFEFAQTFYNNMINVRNRKTITDGKSGGYPTLQKLYWDYLNSESAINVPSNQYTYQKMIDYTLGMGDYWMRLVEQMIPATTQWMGGMKLDNSPFHRQKVVYRRQRGCQIVPVTCIPCKFEGQVYGYDCIDQTVSCGIYPWVESTSTSTAANFQQVLTQTINSVSSTYTTCNLNTVTSEWYVDLRLDSDILVQSKFYTGYGPNDVPTNSDWVQALNEKLELLYQQGLNYFINGNTITIANSSCYDDFLNKRLYLNIGIDLNLICQ